MNRKLSIVLLTACIAGFVLGIVELFKLRFESGDVYPPYSSLRNDPLGASAFYEALQRLPGTAPGRDFSANNDLPEGRDTTYLHLAADSEEWTDMPESSFKVVDQFVKSGGRLVVTLFPEASAGSHLPGSRAFPSPPAGTNSARVPPGRGNPKSRNQDRELEPMVSVTERWGLGFSVRDLKENDNHSYEPVEVLNAGEPDLPSSVAWHSGVVFTNLSPAWRVLYTRGKDAVLIERTEGRGSIVFSSDTYFLSNEAMAKDRHAELLAWLIGPKPRVIFDEAHFGIVQQPGVAMLVRKYQLGGFVAALLLLAGLFIWKNSSPLAPLIDDTPVTGAISGKDSAAGFVNLLRRHVAYRDVLHICLTEWRKSGVGVKYSPARLARAQAAIDAENARPARERHLVRTYQEICQALNERGRPAANAAPATKPESAA